MIQRIQTVFFILAIISLGLFLWMPAIGFHQDKFTNETRAWEVYQFYQGYLVFITAIFAGTAAGFSLLAIFLYKKRSIQVLFGWFAVLFTICAEAFVFYKYQTKPCVYNEFLHSTIACTVKLTFWNTFSILAIVFQLLAIYNIRKDEALLKSVDRLR